VSGAGLPGAPVVHRCGFACLVGRPNAGKSTLANALVGTKVAITSDRPQTTRHTVRGIVHRPDAQLVVVDTPGLHRPRTLLGERLDDLVRASLTEVDLVVFCVAADAPVGPGDRFVATELTRLTSPVVAVVTKSDIAGPERVAAQLLAVAALGDWAEVAPVSAVTGYQINLLADLMIAQLPEGPALYPEGELTDEPERVMVAELIRESALSGVRDELPHSIAVVVEEMSARAGSARGLVDVEAILYVERDSQRAIVLGKGGEQLKRIGTESRAHIEALLGSPVYLDLRVKVAKDWQRDPRQLRRLGF
jgi:GTP-binding protein Era